MLFNWKLEFDKELSRVVSRLINLDKFNNTVKK
jgi:hypothetical protein